MFKAKNVPKVGLFQHYLSPKCWLQPNYTLFHSQPDNLCIKT